MSEREIAGLRLLTERMTDGFAYLQITRDESGCPDAYLLYANPALTELLEWEREELIGQRWSTIWPSAHAALQPLLVESAVTATFEPVESHCRQGENQYALSAQSLHPGYLSTLVRALPTPRSVSPTPALAGVDGDPTVFNLVLSADADLFPALFDQAIFGVIVSDLAGNILYCNPYFACAHGYAPEQMKGSSIASYCSPGREGEFPTLQSVKEGFKDREIWHRHASGFDFPLLVSGYAITDEVGHPRWLVTTAFDVTRHKKVEAQAQQNAARLESLVSIFQRQVSSESELLDFALSEAIKITGSEIGYLYYYDEDKRHFKLNSWSERVKGQCQMQSGPPIGHLDQIGIWGEAVRQRRPLVVNDFSAPHSLKRGYPAGHVPLLRFLTIPVFSGERIVAVVGVANKRDEYGSDDVLQLELLMNGVWRVLERHQTEVVLQSQLAFERMVVDVSSTFVDLPSEQLDTGIEHALRCCGEFFAVDRCYIFRFSRDGERMHNTHEWCAPAIASVRSEQRDFLVNSLPWWAERIRSQDHVYLAKVEELPPEAAAEREYFGHKGIQTLLCIPMLKEGLLQGFLGFDAVKEPREWTERHVSLLRVVAELISSALGKHSAEERIRYLSFRDQLTGLYNRAYFHEELQRSQKSRAYPISIIAADIDGLKVINDSLGHDQGDRLLLGAAHVLQSSMRSDDLIARVGGDEFAIIVPHTGSEAGQSIVERIRQRLGQYNEVGTHLPLSIALGVATAKEESVSLQETLKTADDRMYRDKLQRHRGQRNQLIEALMNSLTERNYVSEGDVEQNVRRCLAVGERMGLTTPQLLNLSLLAHAHDLGKVGIPDHIINKAGALDAAEWEIMHQHAEKGYRIAISSPDLAEIAHLILKHHEHWDGGGYPQRLSGDLIPIECRILAVVIAFSAMTHARPYRQVQTDEGAMAELMRCAGTQFDPAVVASFIEVVSNKGSGCEYTDSEA